MAGRGRSGGLGIASRIATADAIRASQIASSGGDAYTDLMPPVSLLETVSLDPSPTIDAYKAGVDRTILRENLKLTPHERVERMIAALRFAEAVRGSMANTRP